MQNDRRLEERLVKQAKAYGLKGSKMTAWVRKRWQPAAAVAGPEGLEETETPVEEPKPKAKKKKTKKKAAKK